MLRQLTLFLLLTASSFALAEQPRVLASIKPVQQIATAVLDGIAPVDVLLPPGASPHSYALRPSDRRLIEEATRIYWVGPELETFLQALFDDAGSARALMQDAELQLRRYAERDQMAEPAGQSHSEHDHDQAHGQDHHDQHDDHDHGPGSLDTHVWLSPQNALAMARYMAADLGQLYPQHAAQMDDNLQAFATRLAQLDSRLQQRFAALQKRGYFVFHDAYGYFEDHYGLQALGVFSVSHEIQPGARQVNALREQLQHSGAVCVFTEPQFSPRLVHSLTRDLPVRSGVLDPLGVDIAPGSQGYLQTIEQLAESLAGCLEQL